MKVKKLLKTIISLLMVFSIISSLSFTSVQVNADQIEKDRLDEIIRQFDANKEELFENNVPGEIGYDKASSEYKTDRYIIKYRDVKGKEELNGLLKEKIVRTKDIKSKGSKHINAVTLNEQVTLADFVAELKDKKAESSIEFVQPDYELNLSSNDPYFSSQWGLENSGEESAAGNMGNTTDDIPVIEQIRMVMPYIADAIESDPECLDFFTITPAEELWMRIEAMDVPGSLPPELMMELAHDPMLRDMLLRPDAQAVEDAIQQYLCDANVVPAWEISTGSGAVVAVIDTGVDITHEDLAQNIWVNPGEIPENGVDDDENGYIDDVNGWNFSDGNNRVFDSSNASDASHGTHIAGIIAAEKDNNKGIAGVAPSVKVLPLQVFKNGKAYTSNIINAIRYAENIGVKIVNCSWGSTAYNPALKEVIEDSDMLFVTAAGNSGQNIDSNPVYPASFDSSNIITVASVNQNGSLAGSSNYGELSVDIAAPGEDIYSTLPGNEYEYLGGTSTAAAFVTGEAALLISEHSSFNALELKEYIVNYADRLSSLTDKIKGSAMINFANALNQVSSGEIIQVTENTIIHDNTDFTENTDGFSLFTAPTLEGQLVQIAGGISHTIALKNDGTVWTSGYNLYGQLGDGTTISRYMPVQVNGISGVTAIAGGGYYSIALKNDGTVWAWGRNNSGQLGDGSTTNRYTPVQVSGLSGVTAIAGGGYHSIALKNDGTVWAWGYNGYGRLGDGTTTNRYTPVQVSGLNGITAIAGGGSHSLALRNDGTAWAWGYNNYGQLGDGTWTNRYIPVQVSGLSGITAIAGGDSHSIALKNDGTVRTWGDNYYGQLGDGTSSYRNIPVQVSGLSSVTSIAAGNYHSIALKNDGTVRAWGYNYYGQLGNGTTTNRYTPVQVSGLSGVTAIEGGGFFSLALKDDGTVWAWGSNGSGQLGDGTGTIRYTPVRVSVLNGAIAIEGGYNHSIALKNDGTVWAWGYNLYGQLGNGTTTNRYIPVQVSGLSGVSVITGGNRHSLALKNDGTVWAWGYNYNGQLGDGTTTNRYTPVQVSGLSGITAIAGGYNHSIALKNDGTVLAWGHNNYGQLGDGTTTNRYTPVQVSGLSGITAIAGGDSHSLALKNDGTVWAWGRNNSGQLGDGTWTNRYIPVQVSGLNGVTAIAGGGYHNIALKNDGTVWAWGYNNYGQLGDGTSTNRYTPVQVSGLSGITAIAGGDSHNIALKNDGTVRAWGYNNYGQLGDGTSTNRYTPVQVSGLNGITAIAGGGSHSLALRNDGTAWAWGNNGDGQLGNGEKGYSEYAKWAFGTPSTSVSLKYNIACTAFSKFNFVIKADNIQTFSAKTFTVIYSTAEIGSIIDLNAMTYEKELGTGLIQGTNVNIIQNDPGIIKFSIDKPIDPGKTWSGILDVIVFMPSITGTVSILLMMQ